MDRLSGPSSSSCPSFCTQNRNDQRITSSITALLNKTDQESTFLNSKHGKHLLGWPTFLWLPRLMSSAPLLLAGILVISTLKKVKKHCLLYLRVRVWRTHLCNLAERQNILARYCCNYLVWYITRTPPPSPVNQLTAGWHVVVGVQRLPARPLLFCNMDNGLVIIWFGT